MKPHVTKSKIFYSVSLSHKWALKPGNQESPGQCEWGHLPDKTLPSPKAAVPNISGTRDENPGFLPAFSDKPHGGSGCGGG